MSTAAPGFSKHPGHVVDIEPSGARVRAYAGDILLADTVRALQVCESTLPPVWYIPLADVNEELLTKTETSTYCPFKGHASYWRVATSDSVIDDALWAYEDPYTECLALQNHVAFYADRVNIQVQQES
jgi:uncharacterized protein (DUF427 family)